MAQVKESGVLSGKSIVNKDQMSVLSRVPEFMTCLLHLKAYKYHIDRQGPFMASPS